MYFYVLRKPRWQRLGELMQLHGGQWWGQMNNSHPLASRTGRFTTLQAGPFWGYQVSFLAHWVVMWNVSESQAQFPSRKVSEH